MTDEMKRLKASAKKNADLTNEVKNQKQKKKELYEAKEWYTIRALLGNTWANWFILAGARERPLNAVRHSQYKILY